MADDIRIKFKREVNGVEYTDAIYVTAEERAAMSDTDVEAIISARVAGYLKAQADAKAANEAAQAAKAADPTIEVAEADIALADAEALVKTARDRKLAAATTRVQRATKLSDLNDKINYAQDQIDRSKSETTFWQNAKADAQAERAALRAAKGL